MRPIRLAASALIALLAAGCGDSPTASGRVVELGDEFTLRQGQQAVVEGEGLAVQFAGVVEDQRCPLEWSCVRAGTARLRFLLSQPGEPPEAREVVVGDAPDAAVLYGDYAVHVGALAPGKRASRPVHDYRVTLTVQPAYTAAGPVVRLRI